MVGSDEYETQVENMKRVLAWCNATGNNTSLIFGDIEIVTLLLSTDKGRGMS